MTRFRSAALGAAFLCGTALLSGQVSAAPVITVAGDAFGCFGAGCAVAEFDSATLADGLDAGSLTFDAGQIGPGNEFQGTTSAKFGTTGVQLGTFTVNPALTSTDIDGIPFSLAVSFTAPAGVNPTNGTFNANVIGELTVNAGEITITFNDPITQNFTFAGGSFSFTLDKTVIIRPGDAGVGILEAQIRAVPGPIAGAGLPVLAALGGLLWARRRQSASTVAA